MKKIVLLGDSIRLSYEGRVKERLAARATVWSPAENCGHSVNHVFNLRDWYVLTDADVIHFNFGLWDCRRLRRGLDDTLVPVEVFARNLARIIETIRAQTRATPVWGTITPMIEALYNGRNPGASDPWRQTGDIERYNEAAMAVARQHGVAVNDLYALVKARGEGAMINEDGLHYTADGARILGDQVADVIEAALGS
ncbi:MAG: GDSL-type esterase/lipase family protein [Opitutaceae bacterium]|jgi:lysophospholipase L1-like esterase